MREAVAVVSRVAVDVSAPVTVAALVNGSDPVEVFDRARWRWLWVIS